MPLVMFLSLISWNAIGYTDSVRDKYNNGFPEAKYHLILDTFEDVYEAKIHALGGEFVIWRDWGDGAVNMWAEKWGDRYILEVPGGMARYHLIVEEAFILSICHELGHLLGGEPKSGEISYEGQSDYFAGKDCVREILKKITPLQELPEDQEALDFCKNSSFKESQSCQRFVGGAKSLSAYYAEILGVAFPSVGQSSSKIVTKTLSSHPEPQCRLDTFLAGYKGEPRPQCWYFSQYFL